MLKSQSKVQFQSSSRIDKMFLKAILSILCLSPTALVVSLEETITEHCYQSYLIEETLERRYGGGGASGRLASLKEFPHLAAIGWRKGDRVSWGCGGSLITTNFLLTAAHCCYKSLNGKKTPANVARMGVIDINLEYVGSYDKKVFNITDDIDIEEHAQEFDITRVIPYAAYQSNRRYHDIALMELGREAQVTDFVIPICLWNKNNVVFTKLEAAGYGEVEFGAGISPTLMKIEVTKTTFGECQQMYSSTLDRRLPDGLIRQQHVCASDKTG